MTRLVISSASAAALVLGVAPAAHAGGLFTQENGAQAAQRAGAFIAKSDDATALYHNPAGLMKTRRYEFVVGANYMNMSQTVDRSGVYAEQTTTGGAPQPAYVGQEMPSVTQSSSKPVPAFFASQRIGERFALGEGIYGPHGIPTRNFDESVEIPGVTTPTTLAPNPVRYDALEQDGLLIVPSIGFAARVHDKLDVGVRLGWGLGNVESRTFLWAVTNEAEDPGLDGDFRFKASDGFMPNFGAGLLFRPTTWVELGAAWYGPMTFEGKGTGQAILGAKAGMPIPGVTTFVEPIPDDERPECGTGGTAADLKTCLTLDLPQKVTVGGRLIKRKPDGTEQGDIELDVRWENSGGTAPIVLIVDGRDAATGRRLQQVNLPHGHQDVISVRLGGAWRFAVGKNTLEARGGIAYDTAAAPTSWTRADVDPAARITFASGVGYEWSRYRVDVGLSAIRSSKITVERVAIADPDDEGSRVQPDPAQPLDSPTQQEYHPINEGTYETLYLMGIFGFSTYF